jgi:hypothetical protein
LWARAEHTPFGHGRPYSRQQLEKLLVHESFRICRREQMMHFLPLQNRMLLRLAGFCEALGRRGLSLFPGLIAVEVEKQMFAVHRPPIAKRQPVRRFGGQAQPALGKIHS